MKHAFRFRRSVTVMLMLVSAIFLLIKCVGKKDEKKVEVNPPEFNQFAGSAKCAQCHRDIFDAHLNSAHFLSAQPATAKYIQGSFLQGHNRYDYNPELFIQMEKKDSGFYQVVYFRGEKKKEIPFDMVIGAGVKGQSFMYWQNGHMFQLPITWYSIANEWANSPGFPGKVQFDRPITSRCLECHMTYAEYKAGQPGQPETFDRNSVIFGVDCEKCHGPGAKHVEFQTANPAEKIGRYIINTGRLSRQQKLDLCALCHGGNIQRTKESFTYLPGQSLKDYFIVDTLSRNAVNFGTVDVHGNQYGLLRASPCFRMSETLTCNTCHDSHLNERGNMKVFSQRCMSCHAPDQGHFCTLKGRTSEFLQQNCVDCHMPLKKSQSIVLISPGEETPRAALYRSHYISIYPDETKIFLNSKK